MQQRLSVLRVSGSMQNTMFAPPCHIRSYSGDYFASGVLNQSTIDPSCTPSAPPDGIHSCPPPVSFYEYCVSSCINV
jgi:hypothetical protein